MTSPEEEINSLQDVLDLLADDQVRYPVIRTRYDEERKPLNCRTLVLRRDHYRCVICGNGGRLEVDHIIPWSAGGSDNMDNLRTLCHSCNQRRSNIMLPFDAVNRRLPTGYQCVNCTSYLLGEEDITPIHCISCNRNAPGLPMYQDGQHA